MVDRKQVNVDRFPPHFCERLLPLVLFRNETGWWTEQGG